ncbi:NifB/NifX family molybdenum-iron cluster-binding protein [bacterium]|nr:NifB/NifX family molybdenum-iron cluster-binding protein [bacterium]
MKICFPTTEDNGLESTVFGHFGSAPFFVICDTDTMETIALDNQDKIHEHGGCNPLAALGGEKVDAIVVGGIGKGAIMGLNRAGIKVYQAYKGTVNQNVQAWKDGQVKEMSPEGACGGHGNGGGCGGH